MKLIENTEIIDKFKLSLNLFKVPFQLQIYVQIPYEL